MVLLTKYYIQDPQLASVRFVTFFFFGFSDLFVILWMSMDNINKMNKATAFFKRMRKTLNLSAYSIKTFRTILRKQAYV